MQGSGQLTLCLTPGQMEKALAKFGEYFKSKGLGPADIPAAIVIHEVLGLAMAVSFWSACYAIQPSARLLRPAAAGLARSQRSARLHQAYNAAMAHAQATVRRMSWLQKAPGVDPGRLTVSLAESLCFRAAVKPATFVFKLWASWKLVLLMKGGRAQPAGAGAQPVLLPAPGRGKQQAG